MSDSRSRAVGSKIMRHAMSAKILIVDDSVSVRATVRAALLSFGIMMIEATDGLEGIHQIKSHNDLDLVICDVNMPRLDGFGVLRFIASSRANLPVIMLTTNTRPAMVQRGRTLGARTWLTKPLDQTRLVSAVRRILSDEGEGAA